MNIQEYIRERNILVMANEIIADYPLKYWNMENDGIIFKTKIIPKSCEEYQEIVDQTISNQRSSNKMKRIEYVTRIENKFAYARFILREKFLKLMHGQVSQYRMFKLILMSENRNLLNNNEEDQLEYRCDLAGGEKNRATIFYPYIPYIPPNFSVLVAQVLTAESKTPHSLVYSNNIGDYYVEYIIDYAN